MKTIVIAWVTITGLKNTGEMERFDGINWRYKTEVCEEAKAVIWMNEGTAEDVKKAKSYLKANFDDAVKKKVFVFETSEDDPLGKAKTLIVA